MNPSIRQLGLIAQKSTRRIIGLMSGTSLDGVDLALCAVQGNGLDTKIHVEAFHTIPFEKTIRTQLERICFQDQTSLSALTTLNKELGHYYASLITESLETWKINKSAVDLIASHGQTIYHIPEISDSLQAATLQLGDGDQIAHHTGIPTLSDFRQKHIAAGGAGAPLAVYGDFLLFQDKNENRVLLNIGGISNLTYLPENAGFHRVICSDIGPGNALLDSWVKSINPSLKMDIDGKIASSGKVNPALLASMLDDPFFSLSVPKTTGKEYFNLAFIQKYIEKVQPISQEDVLATLCELTVISIKNVIEKIHSTTSKSHLIVSGGGIHHPVLMNGLKNLDCFSKVSTSAIVGIHPDAKEAVLFALLGNEWLFGLKSVFSGNINYPSVSFGKLSLPD